jgi:ubiquinone/menaquinone biosynthesis C-methylase UbiE
VEIVDDRLKINDFYDYFSVFMKDSELHFMNHGYSPAYNFLKEKDLKFKNQISLYLSLFDDLDVKNKSILEVGCGRGGGINSLKEYFNFSKISACDFNKNNIDSCKTNHSKDIEFKVSNAEKLDYEDNEFDIVINVESSHCYKNFEMFFKEVNRVLKPNGLFLYTDCGIAIDNFEKYIGFFQINKKIDITKNVKQACKEDIENYKQINNPNIRDWFIQLSKEKYEEYSTSNSRYISYISLNKKEKNNE